MGMYLSLFSLRDSTIERLMRDPPLVWRVVAPDDPDAYEAERAARRPTGLWARLFARRANDAGSFALTAGEGESADLDKAWQGIHYLLTRTAYEGEPPRNFLLAGGRDVGDIEIGIGPARVFSATETRAIQVALSAVGDAELAGRFDPADMMAKEIYPEIWDRPPAEEDTLGYLMENVRTLRGFLAAAVQSGNGFLVTIG